MRISDWSSDVCSSDLGSRSAVCCSLSGSPRSTSQTRRRVAAGRCLPAVRPPCSQRRPAVGGARKEDRDMSGGYPMEGGCGCRDLRYRLTTAPLIVHCCHCRWCQRETGSAFVLNAVVEDDRLELLHGSPQVVVTPSASGKGQRIARCPRCHLALWSNYAGAGERFHFLRVGTLDDPDRRSEEHTSELQSLMRISYAVFCLKKKKK